MKNILNLHRVPFLFGFLCLALISLMAFQVNWLLQSKAMIEEQFDQKVNLAIGSALTEFNMDYKTSLDVDELIGCDDDDFKYFPADEGKIIEAHRQELEEMLSGHMACYGIDEKYSIEFFDNRDYTQEGTYCCSISTKKNCSTDCSIGVSFLAKDRYLNDQMKPMIVSSILIFILLATVSFMILGSLIKQKRITENNIDFFSNTAHELKTPLTNVSLALKLLSMKHEGLIDDKYVKIIKSENNKLASQIDKVLFLSKIENGEYTLKNEILDLKEILKEVVENMNLLAEEKNAIIKLQLPNNKINIQGDYHHMSNVFRNLIDNALKYSERDPVIEISLVESDDMVKVVFKDNGIGISSVDQSHIFQKFQRVNTGNVKRAKGFGIGLSYVKTIVELHKGLVQVESEVNKGSRFKLLLPNA